jgi:hypothetical protein
MTHVDLILSADARFVDASAEYETLPGLLPSLVGFVISRMDMVDPKEAKEKIEISDC